MDLNIKNIYTTYNVLRELENINKCALTYKPECLLHIDEIKKSINEEKNQEN